MRAARPRPRGHCLHRHHQPARNHRRLGSQNTASPCSTPSSGRTRGSARMVAEFARAWRTRPVPREDRPAARHLFQRPEDPLDPRPMSPGARAQAEARRSPLRQHRHLLALESHRRPDGGVHLTDVTNASRTQLMDLATLRMGSTNPRASSTFPAACCRRFASSSELFGEIADHPPCGRGHRRRSRRSASRPGRPDLLQARARQKTPTAPAAFMLMNTGNKRCSRNCGLLTTVAYQLRQRARHLCAGRQHRHHRRPRAMASRQPWHDQVQRRHRDARANSQATTAASTSSPRSPACMRRTGRPMRAASSLDLPATPTKATSHAQCSKPPPSRPAKSSRPWRPTPALCSINCAPMAAWSPTIC